MCQGLGPKKHDEISEIDRMHIGRATTACREHSQGGLTMISTAYIPKIIHNLSQIYKL